MKFQHPRALLTAWIVVVLVAIGLPWTPRQAMQAQGGPAFSAQIQLALRNFLTLAHTWTATQTFDNVVINGMCTGCAAPGGSNSDIQFNNSGAFGGSANLTFDGTVFTSAKPGNFTSPGVAAAFTTALGVPNAELTWTETAVGQAGNAIQIVYVDPGMAGQSLSASYAAPVLTINLATGPLQGAIATSSLDTPGSGYSALTTALVERDFFAITGVDQGLHQFTLSSAIDIDDTELMVFGSTGNDGLYTITAGYGTTLVTVSEAVPSAVVDGSGSVGSALLTLDTVDGGGAITAYTVSNAGDNVIVSTFAIRVGSVSSGVLSVDSVTGSARIITVANDIIGLGSYDSAPVTVATAPANDGSGVVIALSATNLTGGLAALNVTGPSSLDNGAITTDGDGALILSGGVGGLYATGGNPLATTDAIFITGDPPRILALGPSTDINIEINAQGAGTINLNSNVVFGTLTGAGNLPACLAADGTVFAGSNTAGVLSCP